MKPRIWVLLGHRKGDNNQLLALAQALKLPFETRTIRYNLLRKLPKEILGKQLVSVLPEARKWLQPPWPDLILGVGHRSVPVGRFIRDANHGRTKVVQLGNPRIHPRHFDLVITTPQYGVEDSPNVVRLPYAMNNPHPPEKPTAEELAFFDTLPRPHRLFVIGGPNKNLFIAPEDVARSMKALVQRSEKHGGTAIAIGSPRTPKEVTDAVANAVAGTRHRFVSGRVPRYRTLLYEADEIYVTADSVSMLSEAIFTGKPVGMVPVRTNRRGRTLNLAADLHLRKPPRPNLRAVWSILKSRGMVGTLEKPRASAAADPVTIAADAVLRLLNEDR